MESHEESKVIVSIVVGKNPGSAKSNVKATGKERINSHSPGKQLPTAAREGCD